MENDVKYSLVGAFIVVLGAILVAAVLWLGVGFNQETYQTYLAYMEESVSGLNPKAPVKYRGVDVGFVGAIELDPASPQRVRIELKVREGTPIKEDTVATLATQGLTGLAYVDLSGGNVNSRPLLPKVGEEYAVIQTKPSLFALLGTGVSDILGNISELSKSLNRLSDSFADGFEADRISLRKILTNIESLTGKLDGMLKPENQQAVASILDNADKISRAFGANASTIEAMIHNADHSLVNISAASDAMPKTVQQVGTAADVLTDAAMKVVAISQDVEKAVKEGRTGMEVVTTQTLPQLQTLLAEMQQLAQSMRRLSQSVERNPNMLIFGTGKQTGPGE